MKPDWRRYEEAARTILANIGHALGITSVGPKQKMPGASGTEWELDARAWAEGEEGFLVVEVRRYATSRLKQEDMAAIAFRVEDVGASGGIIVSPLPPQRGAAIIAKSKGLKCVTISLDSTAETYLAEFMGRKFHGVQVREAAHLRDESSATVIHHATQVEVLRVNDSCDAVVTRRED